MIYAEPKSSMTTEQDFREIELDALRHLAALDRPVMADELRGSLELAVRRHARCTELAQRAFAEHGHGVEFFDEIRAAALLCSQAQSAANQKAIAGYWASLGRIRSGTSTIYDERLASGIDVFSPPKS